MSVSSRPRTLSAVTPENWTAGLPLIDAASAPGPVPRTTNVSSWPVPLLLSPSRFTTPLAGVRFITSTEAVVTGGDPPAAATVRWPAVSA